MVGCRPLPPPGGGAGGQRWNLATGKAASALRTFTGRGDSIPHNGRFFPVRELPPGGGVMGGGGSGPVAAGGSGGRLSFPWLAPRAIDSAVGRRRDAAGPLV